MPGTTGREMKGWAFAKFGTNSWGVAASVTKGAYFQGDGGLKFQPAFVEDRSFGQQFLGPADTGDVAPVDLTLQAQGRYDDNNYILEALAMGSPNAVTISTSATGQTTSWKHVLDLAPSIDGLGATFALDRKLYVDEITSAKIYGFGFTIGDGGILNDSFKILGGKPTNISSVNINSTVYGASYPALNGKVFRFNGTLRLNKQSGAGLGAGDTVSAFESGEFAFERPQDRSYAHGQNFILEPGDNEFPAISLRMTFARMNTVTANSLYAALRANDAMKADLTYAGNYINSTDQYTRKYEFGYLELQDFVTPSAGAAQVKPTATFLVKQPAALPTGMSTTNPFRIIHIMTNSVVAF